MNWSGDVLPGISDDVTISSGLNTIEHDSGDDAVHSLTISKPFLLTGGSLTVASTLAVASSFTVAGGTLKDATVVTSESGSIDFTSTGGTFDAVTVASDLTLGNQDYLVVVNGLNFDSSTVTLDNGTVNFQGTNVLSGIGSLRLVSDPGYRNHNVVHSVIRGDSLTIGNQITVQGSGEFGAGQIVNHGTILANVAGSALETGALTNTGTLIAADGGALEIHGMSGNVNSFVLTGEGSSASLDGPGYELNQSVIVGTNQALAVYGDWSNTGGWDIQNGSLFLGGAFTTTDLNLPEFQRTAGAVSLLGLLDNRDAELNLNATIGPWYLAGGTIQGGTLKLSSSHMLMTTGSGGTFDGVTLADDWSLDTGSLFVRNGLTLTDSDLLLQSVDGQAGSPPTLNFQGTQSVSGAGTIRLGIGPAGAAGIEFGNYYDPSIYTLESDIALRGSGYIRYSNLVNNGEIAADDPGQTFDMFPASAGTDGDPSPYTFENHGSIAARNGGRLVARNVVGVVNTVELTGLGSSLVLDGPGYALNQSVIVGTNQALAVYGDWSNTGGWDIQNGSLFLGGAFTTTDLNLPEFHRTAGSVSLVGFLDNRDAELNLNATIGPWYLAGGTIQGGTLKFSNSHMLMTTGSGGTFDGVTLTDDWSLDTGNLFVRNGLTLTDSDILLQPGDGQAGSPPTLNFQGTQSVSGTGTIRLGIGPAGAAGIEFGNYYDPSIYTLESDIALRGSGYIRYSNLVNNGEIVSDDPGQTFDMYPASYGSGGDPTPFTFENHGTIAAQNGGRLVARNVVGGVNTVELTGLGSSLVLDGPTYQLNRKVTVGVEESLDLYGGWSNSGGIDVQGGVVTLGGSSTTARLNLAKLTQSDGAKVYLTGYLENLGMILDMNATTGSIILAGGTIHGGGIGSSGGRSLQISSASGVLDSVHLNTDVIVGSFAQLQVRQSLGLNNGKLIVGPESTDQDNYGNSGVVSFNGEVSVIGSNSIVLRANANGAGLLRGDSVTFGPSITVRGSGELHVDHIVNQGTILAEAGGTIAFGPWYSPPAFDNQGILETEWNGTIVAYPGNVGVSSQILRSSPSSQIVLHGNFLTDTSDASTFKASGTLVLDGGSIDEPRLLEALSRDEGPTFSKTYQNFPFNRLALAANSYVKLVNQSQNGVLTSAAVYVDSLVLPAGAKLDLNGIPMYYRTAELAGTVIGGSPQQVAAGGRIGMNSYSSGEISSPGEVHEWTFDGYFGGRVIDVSVDPATSRPLSPVSPELGWVRVEILRPDGSLIASAQSTSFGEVVRIQEQQLPEIGAGLYRIRISTPPGQSGATGNYSLLLENVLHDTRDLIVDRVVYDTLFFPRSVIDYQFHATAGDQLQLDVLAASASGIAFSLTGPGGFVAFNEIPSDSPNFVVPTSGKYILSARSLVGAGGSYSFRVARTNTIDLVLGTDYHGVLDSGTEQTKLFRVIVHATQPLGIALSEQSNLGNAEVYVKFGSAPTTSDYDFRQSEPGFNQLFVVPQAAAGVWYVLVKATVNQLAAYTLSARSSNAIITGVSPDQAAIVDTYFDRRILNSVVDASHPQITISGAGFSANSGIEAYLHFWRHATPDEFPEGPIIVLNFSLHDIHIVSSTEVTANLDTSLNSLIDLVSEFGFHPDIVIRVTNPDGPSTVFSQRFSLLLNSLPPRVQTRLIMPSELGRHAPATIYVEYINTSDYAIAAPLIVLRSADDDGSDKPLFTLDSRLRGQGFWTSAEPDGFSNQAYFLASGSTPGVLQPGESGVVPVYYAGLQQPWDGSDSSIELETAVLYTDNFAEVPNGAEFAESLRPENIQPEVWNAVYGALRGRAFLLSGFGYYWGSYVESLDRDAQYLASIGRKVTDVSTLWSFGLQQVLGLTPVPALASAVDATVPTPGLSLEFSRVYGAAVTSRFELGSLGRGWAVFEPWNSMLEVEEDGSVNIIGSSGSRRRFQPDSRAAGKYFSQSGDFGTLKKNDDGTYTLTESDGSRTQYAATGAVDFLSDTDGNRITATYAADRLDRLTHSNGAWLEFTYNAAGRISELASSTGQTAVYTYDPTDEYLIEVQDFTGQVTRYTYLTGTNLGARLHALASVEYPDLTHQFFTYDERGRLESLSRDANAEKVTFSYPYQEIGAVHIKDANNNVTRLYYDQHGQVAKVVNPLGATSFFEYDRNLQLSKVTDAAGVSQKLQYDQRGNLIAYTDALGYTTRLSYTPGLNRLSSLTDAKGNVTRYGHDAAGNLTTITRADQSQTRATYNDEGNAVSYTNARGQQITYEYNAAGQMTRKTLPDGAHSDFSYDPLGQLTTIVDAHGTTSFEYDAAGNLTKYTDATGRYLVYTYDNGSRRTSMTDQSGFQTQYLYDTAGRLSGLKDGDDNVVVTYSYDSSGRLSRRDNANGTYTTYAYDAAGQILHLINFAPGGTTANSRFDYTYDILGRRTSMDTLDGEWTYSYDASGQLTHAVFASTNVLIPNQDLTYVYDAMGNRIRTIENGVTTEYTTNDLNQYTSVGAEELSYDADGNLISRGGSLGTTYQYDLEGHLIGVISPSGVTTYEYDALGNRIGRIRDSARTEYLLDPTGDVDTVGEYDRGESTVVLYTYGLGLVSRRDLGGGSATYDFDALGSTSSITDSSGSVLNRYNYTPYGERLQADELFPNVFGFSGGFGVADSLDGSLYVRNRTYAPDLGRFMQFDPIGFNAGDMNTYRYVGNQPTGFVDPNGLEAQKGDLYSPTDFVKDIAPETTTGLRDYLSHVHGVSETAMEGAAGALNNVNSVLAKPADLHSMYVEKGVYTYDDFRHGTPRELQKRVSHGEALANSMLCENGDGLDASCVPNPGNVMTPQAQQKPDSPIASDPNDKTSTSGFGSANFVELSTEVFYRINFENDAKATAPAQQVILTDQLSNSLDWPTFELLEFGFGDERIVVSSASQDHQSIFSVEVNGKSFDVHFDADFNPLNGQLTVRFQSIDPTTDLPPDVLTGFLPPEDGTGRGQGYVTYSIRPRSDVPSGTAIRNVAIIQFDGGEIIATNQIDPHDPSAGTDPAKEALVTIDADGPTSTVTALPGVTHASSFNLSWMGSDDASGSGVASYDIFVSDNGGDYTLFLDDTTLTTTLFTGAFGHTYAFYSVATDNVGHVEAAPVTADTQTLTSVPANQPPHVLDALFSLAENSALNIPVGTPEATDPDASDTLMFSIIGGNGSGAFAMDSVTGAIRVANPAVLDFETTPSFGLTVQVADNHGATDTAEVTINLTDVDESLHLNLGSGDVTFVGKHLPVNVLPQVTVTGAGSLAGGTLTITINSPGKKKPFDLLTAPSVNGIGTLSAPQFVNGHLTLQVQLNGSATIASTQAFLQGVKFSTKGAGLKALSRTLGVTLSAGGQLASISQMIHIQKK